MARVDDAPGVVFVLDAEAGGEDEELASAPARRRPRRNQVLAVLAVAVVLVGLAVRGVLSTPDDAAPPATTSASAASSGAAAAGRHTGVFDLEGPDGTYYDVPYRLAGGAAGARGEGVLPDCAERAVCQVERTLPPATLDALRTSFPGTTILDAWSVVIVWRTANGGQVTRTLQSRVVYAVAGNVTLDIQVRPVEPDDTTRSNWQTGVSGTRTDYATQIGDRLVHVDVFERYVSTKGVLATVRSLVRAGALLDPA